eukprot:8219170-Prorocentrum_lima.AAC.1
MDTRHGSARGLRSRRGSTAIARVTERKEQWLVGLGCWFAWWAGGWPRGEQVGVVVGGSF